MKIKFLATGQSPDYYTVSGETITAHYEGVSETYDLSAFPEAGVFQSADPVNGITAIKHVDRIDGELKVTLCQQVIAGQYPDRKAHWRESEWMDSESYDPQACHAIPTGMASVDDYEIVRGTDVAGFDGWTVRKKAEEVA
ncbi:hypothetical protein [Litchfieldella xinjiangensis]|uniref:hypothetical protein n=1 Tax=Litchfieldella xinjiangensis TaxID=1166948 RepID=UPI0005B86AB7|nr:hypothetical protein [Halomonas xinjiangensis]